MDNWDGTVTNLEDWSSEARSEKVSIRNKAIDQLKQEFDTRPTIVQNLLSGATRSTLIPKEIFVNVFEGLFKVVEAYCYWNLCEEISLLSTPIGKNKHNLSEPTTRPSTTSQSFRT